MSYGRKLMSVSKSFETTTGRNEPYPLAAVAGEQREEGASTLPDSRVFAMLDSIYPNEPFDFDLNPSYCNA